MVFRREGHHPANALSGGRLLGDDWLARMKAAGAFNGRPRELRHNIWAIYCENRNAASSANVIFKTALGSVPGNAVVRAGLMTHRPGPFLQ
jgi:hypothetical protein